MSEVSEHAIEGEAEKENLAKEEALKGFNPDIHATDSEGNPIPRKRGGKIIPGEFQKKRGVKGGTAKKSVVSGGDTGKPQEVINNGGLMAGKTAAHVLITLGCTIGGDEWQPIKNEEYGLDEKENLETAFINYFEATGKTDFPPGVALAIAVGGYVLPRFTQPKTKSRLKRAGEWIYFKWQKIRKKPIKKENSENES